LPHRLHGVVHCATRGVTIVNDGNRRGQVTHRPPRRPPAVAGDHHRVVTDDTQRDI